LRAIAAASAFPLVACSNGGGSNAPVDAAVPDAAIPDAGAGDDASIAPGPSGFPLGRVDRAGRAGINILLHDGDDAARNAYNKEPTYAEPHTASFDRGLAALDALDGKNDWAPDGGAHPLAAALALDVLVVDTAIACDAQNDFCDRGYLELEHEHLAGGAPHATCGGRTLSADAVDTTLSWLIHEARTGTTDGVARATQPASRAFPYLAPPN
jgi:hypothetical protein